MKRLLLASLFFVFVTQYGFSQFFFGGSLSFIHNTQTVEDFNTSSTGFGITPILGYRFESVDVGALFHFNADSARSENVNMSVTSFGFGIFCDFTFLSNDRFAFRGRTSVHYTSSSLTIEGDNLGSDEFIVITFYPMFEYSFSNRFTLFTDIGGISYAHLLGGFSGRSFVISIFSGITLGARFIPGAAQDI